MKKLRNISYSKLNTFLSCGERFKRIYIDGEATSIGISGIRGSSIHKAIQIANKNKMIGNNNDLKLLIDIGMQEFNSRIQNAFISDIVTKEEIELQKTNAIDQIKRGIILYYNEILPNIEPISVEEHGEYEFQDGIMLHGYFDCITKDNIIYDFKTASKTPSSNSKYSMQGTIYAMIYNEIFGVIPKYKICYLVILKKSEKIILVEENINIKKQDIIIQYCNALQKSVINNIYIPGDPGSWMCSEKYCDFYKTCKYIDN